MKGIETNRPNWPSDIFKSCFIDCDDDAITPLSTSTIIDKDINNKNIIILIPLERIIGFLLL